MVFAILAVCFVGLLAASSIVVSVSTHFNMKAANDNTQLQQTMATVADQRAEIDKLKEDLNQSLIMITELAQDWNLTQLRLIIGNLSIQQGETITGDHTVITFIFIMSQ